MKNMKRFAVLLMTIAMSVSMLAGCGKGTAADGAGSQESSKVEETPGAAKSEGVMTYAEYAAAALDSEVTVETYIQAKQGWWEKDGVGVASFYTQDFDGGYFLYNMPCSKEDYDKMEIGTKIKVTGYKAEWSGEVEITDATYEIDPDVYYIFDAEDVTAALGTDDLVNKQNKFVAFTGLTVEAADDNGAAFLYNWDGSGSQGDDLYFNVSVNGQTYSFTVESYLCDSSSEVYKTVEGLKVGDTIDAEGFLYWYEGANPHITKVTVK